MREEIKVVIGGNSDGAQQALSDVGNKAEQVLGKRMGNLVNKAFSALPIAGMATGIALVGQEVMGLGSKALQMSDKFASMKARIDLINDGSQTTADIMDKIYQSAERSRGSYEDTLDTVAKLNMLAKDSFSSNDEAIAFAEQLNMQFKLSGASATEVSSAMTQLTQAMAAGRLQGDEFNSIMENAPMLAQAIAQEMDVPIGKLKQLGSEGKITADVIKEALFNSAEETTAKFAEMPVTFSDVSQQMANTMLHAFQPILEDLASITATEGFKSSLEALKTAIQGMATVAKVAIAGVKGAFTGLIAVGKTITSTFTNIFVAPSASARAFGSVLVGLAAYFATVRVATALFGETMGLASVKTALLTAQQKALRIATALYHGTLVALRAVMVATFTIVAGIIRPMQMMRAILTAVRSATLLQAGATAILNAVMSMNPIPLIVALLAALAAAFIGPKVASEGFGKVLSDVWSSIVHTTVWAINQVIGLINKLIGALNSVGSTLGKVFKFDYSGLSEISEISADTAQSIVESGEKMASTFTDMGGAMSGASMDSAGGSGGGGGGSSSGSNEAQEALEEARRTHEKIRDAYRQMFGSRIEEVEHWREKELEELEKSKDNNEHYQQDLLALNAMYAKKREDALHEEAKRAREIQNQVRDMESAFQFNVATKDSSGDQSPFAKLVHDHQEAMDTIRDRYQKVSDDFAEMTDKDKATFLKALQDKNIAYEVSADGRLTMAKRQHEEELAQWELFYKKRDNLARTNADKEWEIQEALRTQNFEALQMALDEEYIMQQKSYELKKTMMEEFIQATKDAVFSLEELMNTALMSGFSQLQDSLSGLLQGTMTVSQAFQKLGQSMLKALSDYVANWIAAQVKQLVFGKTLQQQQTQASIASANAQTPAWAKLAQQMSMATWGASATIGMAAYTGATAGMSAMNQLGSLGGSLSGRFDVNSIGQGGGYTAPKLKMATGGLAYGRTFAEIGEGQYPEAVLPLSDTVFSRLGEGIRENGGGSTIQLNVSTMDAHSFGSWLESTGGRVLRQFTANTERDFGSEVGVW